MGFFSNLFGGEGQLKAAIRRMERGYGDVRSYSDRQFGDLVNTFIEERTNNINLYSNAYNQAVTTFADTMKASREAYAAAGKEAYATLTGGRDATVELLKQTTDAAVARSQMSGMLTGLSNTSFGQAAVNAVAAQGALQIGAVKEQYSQTLASAQQAQANAMANMEAQAAGSIFSAGLGSAQYQSGMYQAYTSAAQAARQAQLQSGINLRTRPIEARYAADTQRALQNQQAGQAFGGAILGATIGAGASALGQSMQGYFQGAGGGGGAMSGMPSYSPSSGGANQMFNVSQFQNMFQSPAMSGMGGMFA
jgi:hypothetical protein